MEPAIAIVVNLTLVMGRFCFSCPRHDGSDVVYPPAFHKDYGAPMCVSGAPSGLVAEQKLRWSVIAVIALTTDYLSFAPRHNWI